MGSFEMAWSSVSHAEGEGSTRRAIQDVDDSLQTLSQRRCSRPPLLALLPSQPFFLLKVGWR